MIVHIGEFQPLDLKGRVSPKDIALVKFSENDSTDAHFMSPDKYVPLLEWLHSADYTKSRLEVSNRHRVTIAHTTTEICPGRGSSTAYDC
jgi:hypothetical protein